VTESAKSPLWVWPRSRSRSAPPTQLCRTKAATPKTPSPQSKTLARDSGVQCAKSALGELSPGGEISPRAELAHWTLNPAHPAFGHPPHEPGRAELPLGPEITDAQQRVPTRFRGSTREVKRSGKSLHEPGSGRDIALRCPRPRTSGRNRCAAERGADGAARHPYQVRGFNAQGRPSGNSLPSSDEGRGQGERGCDMCDLHVASFTLETAVQPKETKEAKEFEGIAQTRTLTCRVNGACLRTSFLSEFFVFFGHPTAGLKFKHGKLSYRSGP